MMAKALWHKDSVYSEFRKESLPEFPEKGVELIRTQYSMLSTGTERTISMGRVSLSLMDQMKVPYMKGDFSLPIKYGYACCGFDSNRNAYHYMHPHQDICQVAKEYLFMVNDLDPKKIPLISNMETVLNALWDADLKDSDRIAVIGYGNIGCLLVETLKLKYKNPLSIIEVDQWRLEQAISTGCKNIEGQSFDVIFNTSSSASAINMAFERLNKDGRLIQIGWVVNPVSINLSAEFHYNRLKLISSQVSQIPLHVQSKFDYTKRKQLAVSLLRNAEFDKLITNIIDFDNADKFFNDLRRNQQDKGLIYLFKY